MSLAGNSAVGNDGIVSWFITQLIALGTLLASLAGWIPYAIVAAIPTLYYLVMLWETRTFVHLRNNWRTKRIARRYIKAQARAKIALAKLDAIELLRHARHDAREKVEQASAEAAKLVVQKTAETKSSLPPL